MKLAYIINLSSGPKILSKNIGGFKTTFAYKLKLNVKY